MLPVCHRAWAHRDSNAAPVPVGWYVRAVPEQAPTSSEAADVQLRIPELAGRARVRRLIALALFLVLGVAAVVYYTRPQPVLERYRTYPVAARTLVQMVDAAGRIDVRNRVEVPAPMAGRIIAIHVKQGQIVKQGDLLAELDERAAALAVRAAQAAVEAAAGGSAQARAALDAATRGLERAKALNARGLASAEDIAKAQSELAQASAALGAARGGQNVAAQNVASAALSKDLGRMVAPAGGVVLRAPERLGAAVGAEKGPLFVIGDPLITMRVDASVSETEVAMIKPGQAAEVLVAAVPDRSFRGRVDRISIEPDRVEGAVLYPVVLLVDNPDGVLLPGMTARARLEVARVTDKLSVHEAALRFSPEGEEPAAPRTRVWKRVGPHQVVPIKVRTGVSDGAYTQIEALEGQELKAGDELAVGLARPDEDSGPKVKLGAGK